MDTTAQPSVNEVSGDEINTVTLCITAIIGLIIFYLVFKFHLNRAIMCPSKERIDGKSVIITGGNSGIGRETARQLALRGGHIILACRDMTKANNVAKELKAETGNENIQAMKLDLSSMQSVRDFVHEIYQSNTPVDILINNAGTGGQAYTVTEDGFELTMAVNYLGPFLLTTLLLPALKLSSPSRVINVAAHSHVFGRINFDDLRMEVNYSPFKVYCQSKLALIMFTRELSHRLQDTGVNVYAVHPGVTLTPMRHHNSTLMKVLLKHFYKTPVEGCQTTLFCAVTKHLSKQSGLYYSNCAYSTPMKDAFNTDIVQRLWDATEDLLGLPPSSDEKAMELEGVD